MDGSAPPLSAWLLGAPALPSRAAGACLALTSVGERYALTDAPVWHGVATALTRDPHAPAAPFSAWPGEACWWLWTRSAGAITHLAGRRLVHRIGRREHAVVTVSAARPCVLPPPRAPERHRVAIHADTPVAIRCHGGTVVRAWPDDVSLTSTLAQTLAPRVLGRPLAREDVALRVTRDASVAAVARAVPSDVRRRGAQAGWTGRVEVECSGLAAWLLECAVLVGLGGRTAFGLGRVRVEVTPWS